MNYKEIKMNYKERCKNCCYLFKFTPKGEWCCDCYEKLCKQINVCPQVENTDEVILNG